MSASATETTFGPPSADQAVVTSDSGGVHLDTSKFRITMTPSRAFRLAGQLIRGATAAQRAEAEAEAEASAMGEPGRQEGPQS